MGNESKNAINYLYIIVKWRKLIIINFLLISVLAAGFSLIMPKTYRANTIIMPPSDDASGIGLSSLLSGTPFSGMGLGGMSEGVFQFLAILNSRTIMESIVVKYDLINRYQSKNLEEAIEELRENISVEVNDDGTIGLSVNITTEYMANKEMEDGARLLASDLTNYFVIELDRINKSLKTDNAKNTRIFIEKRYLQNIDELNKAEEALKLFQNNHGIVSIENQVQSTITLISELQARIVSKQIEMEILKKNYGENNSGVISIGEELKTLKRKLSDLKNCYDEDGLPADSERMNLILQVDSIPDLSLQYARLYRNVLLQEKILEFILPQYEQAKIQEMKDTPTVQVLDKAVPPIKRVKPRRGLLVLACGLLTFIISILFVFSVDHIQRIRSSNNEDAVKLNYIFDRIRQDLGGLIKRNKLKD